MIDSSGAPKGAPFSFHQLLARDEQPAKSPCAARGAYSPFSGFASIMSRMARSSSALSSRAGSGRVSTPGLVPGSTRPTWRRSEPGWPLPVRRSAS